MCDFTKRFILGDEQIQNQDLVFVPVQGIGLLHCGDISSVRRENKGGGRIRSYDFHVPMAAAVLAGVCEVDWKKGDEAVLQVGDLNARG